MELQWCYIYTPASALSTSRSNEDLKLLDGLTPQTRCICDKRMEILNRRDQMRGLTPNILPHSPHMLPQQTKFQEIGNSNVAIRATNLPPKTSKIEHDKKLRKSLQKASPANGQCGPGLRESRCFPFIPFFGAQWTRWRIVSLSSTEHTQWVGPKLPASETQPL